MVGRLTARPSDFSRLIWLLTKMYKVIFSYSFRMEVLMQKLIQTNRENFQNELEFKQLHDDLEVVHVRKLQIKDAIGQFDQAVANGYVILEMHRVQYQQFVNDLQAYNMEENRILQHISRTHRARAALLRQYTDLMGQMHYPAGEQGSKRSSNEEEEVIYARQAVENLRKRVHDSQEDDDHPDDDSDDAIDAYSDISDASFLSDSSSMVSSSSRSSSSSRHKRRRVKSVCELTPMPTNCKPCTSGQTS